MTDKQLACACLNRRLWGIIPDHDELRDIAGSKLSEDRCRRVAEKIIEMARKMRKPLVRHLNNTGVDAT